MAHRGRHWGRLVGDGSLFRTHACPASESEADVGVEVGGVEATARSVLMRLIQLLEVLEAEDEPEAAEVTRPKPTKGAQRKPAE